MSSTGFAFVSLRWEPHAFSKIEGESYADLPGIGRFSIRKDRVEKGKFSLKLNGSFLLRSNSLDVLKAFALAKVSEIMRST